MGWVVKSLRGDALAALAPTHAATVLGDAEREARRVRRVAAREADQALAALTALEILGVESRDRVRAERRRIRSRLGSPALRAVEPVGRRGRASLRESPVVELFRRT